MTSSLPDMNCSERRLPRTQPHSGLECGACNKYARCLPRLTGSPRALTYAILKKPSDCSTAVFAESLGILARAAKASGPPPCVWHQPLASHPPDSYKGGLTALPGARTSNWD